MRCSWSARRWTRRAGSAHPPTRSPSS